MAYIALRTLNSKRRLIRKGEKVPSNYPMLNVAIKRGWVIEESNIKPKPVVEPVAPTLESPTQFQIRGATILEPDLIPKPPDSSEPEKPAVLSIDRKLPVAPAIEEAPEPEVEVEPEVEIEVKPEVKGSEESFTDEVSYSKPLPPLIADLEFLSNRDITKLTEKGIVNVMDLEGWTSDQLTDIRGIGLSKANKLLDEHQDYEKSK